MELAHVAHGHELRHRPVSLGWIDGEIPAVQPATDRTVATALPHKSAVASREHPRHVRKQKVKPLELVVTTCISWAGWASWIALRAQDERSACRPDVIGGPSRDFGSVPKPRARKDGGTNSRCTPTHALNDRRRVEASGLHASVAPVAPPLPTLNRLPPSLPPTQLMKE